MAERLAPDGTVSTDLCCGSEHEGGSGVAHGGWVADVLDELVGHVPLLHGQLAVTGRLSIEFLRPVPVDRMLRGTAVVTGREGSRWFVDARLHLQAGGALLAVGQGVLVERDLAHYSRFASWLAEQGTED